MSKRYKLLFILFLMVLHSCKETIDDTTINDGKSYYNNKTGSWVIYKVDSIVFSDFNPNVQIIDTFTYQVKELLAEKFTDNSGEENNRIERYTRKSDTLPWTISAIWSSKLTSQNLQKVEENIRYVKLAFPVFNEKTWAGNAFNGLVPTDYVCKNVKSPVSVNGVTFQNTVTVIEKDSAESNLIMQQFAREVYAEGIGLILRQVDTLETQGKIKKGLHYRQTIIDWSK